MSISNMSKDTKPAYSLLDIFLDSLREKYVIETYSPTPNCMTIRINVEVGSEPIIINISNLALFRDSLFFYLSSLNGYYLKTSRKPLEKSIGDIFRNLLVGITKADGLDFLEYVQSITHKINSLNKVVLEGRKKM